MYTKRQHAYRLISLKGYKVNAINLNIASSINRNQISVAIFTNELKLDKVIVYRFSGMFVRKSDHLQLWQNNHSRFFLIPFPHRFFEGTTLSTSLVKLFQFVLFIRFIQNPKGLYAVNGTFINFKGHRSQRLCILLPTYSTCGQLCENYSCQGRSRVMDRYAELSDNVLYY